MTQPTYLSLSPLLSARLEAVAPTGVKVLTSASLEEAESLSQKAPALAALFAGAAVVTTAGDQQASADAMTRWESRWDIAAIVSTAKQRGQHVEDMHASAEQLMSAVLPKLIGWMPGAGFGRLRAEGARLPIIRRSVALFPVRFITTHTMRSEP